MGNPLNVNVPEVAREIFIQSLREMNIQRLRNPSQPVSDPNPMHMKPIVDKHIPKVLLGLLVNWEIGNKNPLRKQRSPLWRSGFSNGSSG
jgi:hypothetical protein